MTRLVRRLAPRFAQRGAPRGPWGSPVGGGIIYPASGAEWATWAAMGTGLTAYWRFTAIAGDELDLVGNVDLTNFAGACTQGVADEALNSVCVQYTAGSGNRMEAADPADLDPGAGDFLWWWVGRLLDPSDSNLRGLAGKRNTADPFVGAELWATPNSRIRMNLDGGATADAEDNDAAWTNSPLMIVADVDRNANLLKVFAVQDGVLYSSPGQPIDSADCDATDTGTFRFGYAGPSDVRTPSMLQSAGGVLIGTGARGFTAAKMTALATQMGML